MPYLDVLTRSLPYAPLSPTSHAGAVAAQASAQGRCAVMREVYRRHPEGVCDADMVRITGFPINVVTARRNDMACVKVGTRKGRFGVNVAAWALPEGR